MGINTLKKRFKAAKLLVASPCKAGCFFLSVTQKKATINNYGHLYIIDLLAYTQILLCDLPEYHSQAILNKDPASST